jgi:hypothetical protein
LRKKAINKWMKDMSWWFIEDAVQSNIDEENIQYLEKTKFIPEQSKKMNFFLNIKNIAFLKI